MDDESLESVGGVIVSAEVIKTLPDIISKLGEVIGTLGEAIGFLWANKKKTETQKDKLTELSSELEKLQAGIRNSGILILQYNKLYDLSTKSQTFSDALLNVIRRAVPGVYKE